MAVADVGVAIGPRNRRRLTTGGVTLGVVAALASAGLFLSRSPNHRAGSAASTRSAQIDPAAPSFPYGMTDQQVRSIVGRPTTTHGSCWDYSVKTGRIGSVSLGEVLAARGADGMRFCFFAGALSNQYLHLYDPKKGRWIWVTRFYLGPSK
jgi:hypothetical protein